MVVAVQGAHEEHVQPRQQETNPFSPLDDTVT